MAGTITVQGTGRISLMPDTAVIRFTVREEDMDYGNAMSRAKASMDLLGESLERAGFGPEDLKTSDIRTDTLYGSECDEKGVWHNVFRGYSCAYALKLEFPLDPDVISKVLRAVSSSMAEPEINMSFTVKDRESPRKELLRRACLDAEEKAGIIAETSGAKLGKLISASYGGPSPVFMSPTNYSRSKESMAMGCDEAAIVPEDMTETDEVTCVYEIAQ